MSTNSNLNEKLGQLNRKLDIVIVVLLAKSGLTRKEIADVLGISEKTIERMVPFEKLKQKRHEQ